MNDVVKPEPDPVKGVLVGIAAGVVASFAMDQFQALVAKLSSSSGDGEPATDKAADKIAVAMTGRTLDEQARLTAGSAVHYVFGAALGAAYGIAAEYRPEVTAGGGIAFGMTTASLLDETAVPLAGLSKAPWNSPPSTHAYAFASHLVFGVTAETTRRLLRTV